MGDDIVALPDINTENTEAISLITEWVKNTVLNLIQHKLILGFHI
jgi:hypothetical protein